MCHEILDEMETGKCPKKHLRDRSLRPISPHALSPRVTSGPAGVT
ncbi:hypothetical protein HNR65_000714 [Desulfosalsimonas propionicica]|uniref:Uncharacterized protein n=1 Tax=Desulfosalsimonas propionicica TaxID=332175 RepID=A0A7W0C759_9BACT|nr:hypothetical protein [Desulfosalsimonas propionicica]MBA2880396.1 hypothetical protein [Desulfosalsimonas propionicica]